MKAAIALFIALVSGIAAAFTSNSHDLTANELLSACTADPDSNQYAVCVLVMYGFNARADATLADKPWCKPPNLILKEQVLALVRIWHSYPELMQQPLSVAIGSAMVTAYPCHSKK